jgi:ribosomal protein S27AE
MVDVKKAKAKKQAQAQRVRKERRFLPEPTYASRLSIAGGMLGALLLGAGVYGQWLSDNPRAIAPYLFVVGAISLVAALWFGDAGALPVRLGDAGIAIEKGSELVRLAWCDIERVFVERGELIAKGKELTLRIPIAAQRKAVAWVLSEGTQRMPTIMDVKRQTLAGLPEPKDNDGEFVVIDGLQVAGRHCAASGKPVSFERDARLCPNCGQVYLKDHVPGQCLTCQAALGAKAAQV